MTTIHLPNVRHLSSLDVFVEVNGNYGVNELSDQAAVTIASWYQSPGREGRALAALASGAPVERDDLIQDVSHVIAQHYARCGEQDKRCLDMLGTWAIRLPRALN